MIVTLHSAPADLRGFKLSLWDWRSWPQLHLCVEFVDKSFRFWAPPAFCEMIGLRFEIISCPTLTPHTPPKRTSSRGIRIRKILWSKKHIISIRIKRTYYQDQTKTILREGRKEGRKEGGREGRKEGRTAGRTDGRKEGRRKEGRKEGRKDGRTEGRN